MISAGRSSSRLYVTPTIFPSGKNQKSWVSSSARISGAANAHAHAFFASSSSSLESLVTPANASSHLAIASDAASTISTNSKGSIVLDVFRTGRFGATRKVTSTRTPRRPTLARTASKSAGGVVASSKEATVPVREDEGDGDALG